MVKIINKAKPLFVGMKFLLVNVLSIMEKST